MLRRISQTSSEVDDSGASDVHQKVASNGRSPHYSRVVSKKSLAKRNQICTPNSYGIIDDTNLCVAYNKMWMLEQPGINIALGGSSSTISTTHWTAFKGASCSVMFNGIGISVSTIYPVTKLPLASVSFQIDSSPATIVSALNGTLSPLPTQQIMFTSGTLTPSTHTLTVQLVNEGNFTLNFFTVFGSGSGAQNSSTSHSPSKYSDSSNPVGKVIGGVFGGIIAALLCAALIYFLRRRNRRRRSRANRTVYPPSTYYAPSYKEQECQCSRRHDSVTVPPSAYLGSEQLFVDMQYSPRSTNFSFPQFASNPSESGKRRSLPEKIPSVMA